MERYTPEQRSEIVDLFYKNNCSFVSTLRNLRRIHGRHFSISRPTVRRFVDKFESKTSDLTKVPVRQRNARTKENIDLVAASVKENPNLSIPRRSQQLNLSQTTTWRILRNDLGLHDEHEDEAHKESDLDNLDKSHSSDASVEGIEMKSQNKPCRSKEMDDKERSETDETSSVQNQENTAPNPNSPPVALNQNSNSPLTAAPVSPDPSGRSSSPSEPLSPVSSYVSSSSES